MSGFRGKRSFGFRVSEFWGLGLGLGFQSFGVKGFRSFRVWGFKV